MAELKTKVNQASVKAFIDDIADAEKRAFAKKVIKMMRTATGNAPKMWGKSIVGFGKYTYTYATGRSGDWMRVGFSPRAAAMTLYIMPGFELQAAQLKRLGKCSTGKSCLYVKRESDIDLAVLQEMIEHAVKVMAQRYGTAKNAKASSTAARASKKKTASKKKAG